MMKNTVIAFFIFTLIFGFYPFNKESKAAFDCLTLNSSSSQADKDYCRKELSQIEAQLAELVKKQKEQQKQTGTLKGDVSYLNSQINALKTKVKARSLVIAQLRVNIAEKNNVINSLSQKIKKEHQSLAQLLRNTNEFDNLVCSEACANVVHLVLSDEAISDFYGDTESYAYIQEAIKASVDEIKGVKSQTELAKQDLERKQDAETDAKAELESAQQKTAAAEAEKKRLLSISQKTEAEYQKLAAEKKARAAKIRAALFPLAGTATKIDFGTALTYAKEAQKLTGIEPAFLMAILTQESNLGSNVGQCYLTNKDTGAGVGKNTGVSFPNVMKPMGLPGRKGDVDDFIRITSKLGLVWNKTAISCPIAGVAGYGGAMGPAQFIPTTWTLFEGRLRALLGYDANPWAPKDAFMASAMYLTDLGAVGTSVAAQQKAACKYYGTGGASCTYSNGVMNHKTKIQANIDLLSQ